MCYTAASTRAPITTESSMTRLFHCLPLLLVVSCGGDDTGKAGISDTAADPRCKSLCASGDPGDGLTCSTASVADCISKCDTKIYGLSNACGSCLLENAQFGAREAASTSCDANNVCRWQSGSISCMTQNGTGSCTGTINGSSCTIAVTNNMQDAAQAAKCNQLWFPNGFACTVGFQKSLADCSSFCSGSGTGTGTSTATETSTGTGSGTGTGSTEHIGTQKCLPTDSSMGNPLEVRLQERDTKASGGGSITHNSSGQITEWQSSGVTEYFTYNSSGNLTEWQQQQSGHNITEYFTYNSSQALTEWQHQESGHNVTEYFTYNSSGAITEWQHQESGDNITEYFTYNSSGAVTEWQHQESGNDSTEYFSYDSSGQLTNAQHSGAGGGSDTLSCK